MERVHQVIADSIRAMNLSCRQYNEDSSHAILQTVAWGIRSTYHTALKVTPGQLTFGRDMIIGSTYLANWKMINEERKKMSAITTHEKIKKEFHLITNLTKRFTFFPKILNANLTLMKDRT